MHHTSCSSMLIPPTNNFRIYFGYSLKSKINQNKAYPYIHLYHLHHYNNNSGKYVTIQSINNENIFSLIRRNKITSSNEGTRITDLRKSNQADTSSVVLSSAATSFTVTEENEEPKNKRDILHKLTTLNPWIQCLITFLFYAFHMTVLSQHVLVFPFQLIPNNKGYFQSIGFDSISGIIALLVYLYLQKTNLFSNTQLPSLLQEPHYRETPWKLKLPLKNNTSTSASISEYELQTDKNSTLTTYENNIAVSSLRAFMLLLIAYGMTGKFSLIFEDIFYILAGLRLLPFHMTIAIHRALVVLFGHLMWVGIGSTILRLECKGFFRSTKKSKSKTKWYTFHWKTNWVWWVVGGYYFSTWMFNIADFVNQLVLPSQIFESAAEGVVSQLVNPENNDLLASVIGYIAPCISAPWWEEVLYRGFMLPALTLHMTFWPAVLVSGLIFSAHHVSTVGFIPLAVLGMTWAVLYTKCRNLFVTIAIHALWNSRVFFGSWLGL